MPSSPGSKPGAACASACPAGLNNLLFFDAISLRAGVDPLAPLNAQGQPQAFAVRLTDGAGMSATVATRPDEPALPFPAGDRRPRRDSLAASLPAGVPLTTIRVPLQ